LNFHQTPRPDLPPFQGGWAGLFSYDLGRDWQSVPLARSDAFQTPHLALGFYDVVIAFDHQQNAAWIISQGFPETSPEARRDRASARLAYFREVIGSSSFSLAAAHDLATASRLPLDFTSAEYHVPDRLGLTSNFTPEAYRAAVSRVIDYIHAGDVFQVNLAQRLLLPADAPSVEAYCRLREVNPAPFAGYFDLGDSQILSASPERFLRVHDRLVETRPIKGTAQRFGNDAADRSAAIKLLNSSKNRAENVMIVDLMRNDLSMTCRPESVRVTQLCGLESFASVHHLVSAVEGELRDDKTPFDLLQTCLPGGSVTGAPKLRAMEIISELEPSARGAYCGALGYLGVGGQMDTSVLIRTVTAARGWWQFPAGGGIVAQSDPDAEYQETWHKARGLLRALSH
jgi:para-aminobenzoate synthetase component 1